MKMKNIEFKNAGRINTAALDAEIRAALGGDVAGISSDGAGTVTVHLLDESLNDQDVASVVSGVLKNHDPEAKTAEQTAAEQSRQKLIDFVTAAEPQGDKPMTSEELTAAVVELRRIVKLLVGARDG